MNGFICTGVINYELHLYKSCSVKVFIMVLLFAASEEMATCPDGQSPCFEQRTICLNIACSAMEYQIVQTRVMNIYVVSKLQCIQATKYKKCHLSMVRPFSKTSACTLFFAVGVIIDQAYSS